MSCLIRVPTEVVKSRTQTSAYGAGGSLHSFTNTLKLEGIKGFYRGFGITIAREVSLGLDNADADTIHIYTISLLRIPKSPSSQATRLARVLRSSGGLRDDCRRDGCCIDDTARCSQDASHVGGKGALRDEQD
jgi:hypothetical protein